MWGKYFKILGQIDWLTLKKFVKIQKYDLSKAHLFKKKKLLRYFNWFDVFFKYTSSLLKLNFYTIHDSRWWIHFAQDYDLKSWYAGSFQASNNIF